jgi:cytidylate kinase
MTDGIKVLKDTNDITLELRTETTAKTASQISALEITRNNLLDIQRNFYSD